MAQVTIEGQANDGAQTPNEAAQTKEPQEGSKEAKASKGKTEMLQNVKHNGNFYKKGGSYTLDAETLKEFRAKKFVA